MRNPSWNDPCPFCHRFCLYRIPTIIEFDLAVLYAEDPSR
jgi:hypothetical protein